MDSLEQARRDRDTDILDAIIGFLGIVNLALLVALAAIIVKLFP